MDSRIVYKARADARPDEERNTLANVYRFVLDCHAKNNAAGVNSTNGDDEMKGTRNDLATTIVRDR
jgi:hypothetical protein